MSDFNSSRRNFMKQTAATASMLALSLQSGKLARAAQDAVANPDPRFLINIHNRGGMDAYWWHAYAKGSELNAIPQGTPGVGYAERFPESQAIQHPLAPEHFLGVGMSMFTATDLSKIAIWKGIGREGDHDIGNRIINCGMMSNYAASFSAIVSQTLAQRSTPLPLHYVLLAADAASLYTHFGLLTGYGQAVCIPDEAAFRNLTSPLGNDVPTARRAAISDAVVALYKAAASSGFKRKSSLAYFSDFISSTGALGLIYGSNIAKSPEFAAIQQAYVDEAVSAFDNLLAVSPDARARIAVDITPSSAPGLYFRNQAWGAAFRFAMAEFLIRKNLTRVIDIGPANLNMDAHGQNGAELATMTVKFSMLRTLIRRLSSPDVTGIVPGTAGHSFLDHTTVVMATEFDRQPWWELERNSTPGTNHGTPVSAIFAGRGVQGGKVFGDFKTAPGANGKYAGFESFAYTAPLPVNLATGQPDLSGRILTTKSILPTILALFGISVPPEQQTEGMAFPALIA